MAVGSVQAQRCGAGAEEPRTVATVLAEVSQECSSCPSEAEVRDGQHSRSLLTLSALPRLHTPPVVLASTDARDVGHERARAISSMHHNANERARACEAPRVDQLGARLFTHATQPLHTARRRAGAFPPSRFWLRLLSGGDAVRRAALARGLADALL
eukprot:3025453-Pleurochrysis_carterae.AAC.1